MEESSGAQYALQVALQTLKDRCRQFQQRIVDLEDENLNLRSQCKDSVWSEPSVNEIHALNKQISQLTEQKLQLTKKVEMVTAENNNLWTRLSKLTLVKENLDSKLIKIKDSISSRMTHSNLVRSKTFTHDEPHFMFSQDNIHDESDKISFELEDISLKLLNSIAKEKEELEIQCSQMAEIQTSDVLFSNSYAFACTGEDVTECDEVDKQLATLTSIKFTLLKQKEKLQSVEDLISRTSNKACTTCSRQKSTITTSVQTTSNNKRSSLTDEENAQLQSLVNWGTPDNSLFHMNVGESPSTTTKETLFNDNVKICPMCSKTFHSAKLSEFQEHVENHFILQSDPNYDIMS